MMFPGKLFFHFTYPLIHHDCAVIHENDCMTGYQYAIGHFHINFYYPVYHEFQK